MHQEDRIQTHLYQDFDQVSHIFSMATMSYDDFARFRLLMESQAKTEV